ncbi:MAG: hypothetical protein R3F59_38625, partial [Myxococcota bacterium]
MSGQLTLGRYGLFREGPLAGAHGPEYLSPEQTRPAPVLAPSTDVFALGSLLYELLTRRPLFKADTVGRTLERIRTADIQMALVEVRELLPGLDKVLFRALSANPQHRYQRAFVLREDLRGLMAGHAFGEIGTVARSFLSPIAHAVYDAYMTGALPAPAPRRGLVAEIDLEAAATEAIRAPAPRSAGEQPDTEWVSRGPGPGAPRAGARPPRKPIDLLPDTERVSLAARLDASDAEELATARMVTPFGNLALAEPAPEPPLGAQSHPDPAEADELPTAAWPAPSPVPPAREAAPLPVGTAPPLDVAPLAEISRSSTALRVRGARAPAAVRHSEASELPTQRFQADDLSLPLPLSARAAHPSVVIGTSWASEPPAWARAPSQQRLQHRLPSAPPEPLERWRAPAAEPPGQPLVSLTLIALGTALLCVVLCLGPPAGVLWAAAVSGTDPQDLQWD